MSISGKKSDQLSILCGVLQGTILGPTVMLFLTYINDLPHPSTHSLTFLFADDTKCLKQISSSSDRVLLQCDIDATSDWAKLWNLSFNKTKYLMSNSSLKQIHL